MNELPVLRSGARMQYPVRGRVRCGTRVFEFLDGGEQRHAVKPVEREWTLALARLGERELWDQAQVVGNVQGDSRPLRFESPLDGTVRAGTRLTGEHSVQEWRGQQDGSSVMNVREGEEA